MYAINATRTALRRCRASAASLASGMIAILQSCEEPRNHVKMRKTQSMCLESAYLRDRQIG